MAQKTPQPSRNPSDTQGLKSAAKRPPLPDPMPVQYYETIEKSWRGHSIPKVPRHDDHQ